MKIIKPGTKMDATWTGEFECSGHGNGNRGCGAVLEVSEGDLFRTYSSAMGEGTDYVTFMCPCCGELTDIYNSDGYHHPGYPSDLFRVRELPFVNPSMAKEARRRLKAGTYTPPHKIPQVSYNSLKPTDGKEDDNG